MSAFIVNSKTMSDIQSGLEIFGQSNDINLNFLKKAIKEFLGKTSKAEKIKEMRRLNLRAVNYRYNKDTKEDINPRAIDDMCQLQSDISLFQFLKSLECLHYQMCEGEIVKTKIYNEIDKLISACCYTIAHNTPQYEAANWD